MKIGNKLVLLVALPLLGLSFLGWRTFSDSSHVTGEMGDLESLTQIASQVSSLVHETQKERGMTAGFLGSGGTKFGPELAGQRRRTDEQGRALTEVVAGIDLSRFDRIFSASLTKATDQFARLTKIRSGVDAQTITAGAAISAYTRMNADFLDSVAYMSKLSSDGSMSVKLAAYVSFLKGKERAGIERAVLSSVFAADAFGDGMYTRFVALVTEQDTYFREFRGIADANLVEALDRAQASQASQRVDTFRQIAHSKSAEGGFEQDASEWFTAATSRIGELREVEVTLSEDIAATATSKRSAAAAARMSIGAIVGALVVVVIALSVFIARQITRPIKALTSRIKDIAEGEGDLTQRVDADRKDELGELGKWFNTFVEKIHGIITDVSVSTREVASAATEIAASAEQMAAGLASQQDQTTQVSAAVEEMSATVGEVSAKSSEAARAAQKSGSEATEGGVVVTETVDEMSGIAEQVNIAAIAVAELGKKGDQIGEIISVINDIADQTNLLALNAAIEAARAGEHGRGFAVVADEVRKLAERTTDATEEVGRSIREIQDETDTAVKQIQASTERVGRGVELASNAGEALARIVDSSKNVQSMVQSIAAASEQQATASTQIAGNVEQIDSITRESLEGARQAASASTELSTQAEGLREIVGQFKI